MASRCDATAWRVRIDDIDPPRAVPGSAGRIVACLVSHGFPDAAAPPELQSSRLGSYRSALRALCGAGALFACGCTRRTLSAGGHCLAGCAGTTLRAGPLEALLPGPLAAVPRPPGPGERPAVRVRLEGTLEIGDRVQGPRRTVLEDVAPDAVVLRRDGLISYHLATAVDDARVDDVVRGADLLDSTAVQVALMRRLGSAPPRYAHVPVALDAAGDKLGKSSGAAALDPRAAARSLALAWAFLGQRPLAEAREPVSPERFWREAPARWRMADVPRVPSRRWPDGPDDPGSSGDSGVRAVAGAGPPA